MKIEYILNNMVIETEEDLEFACKVTNKTYKMGDYVDFKEVQHKDGTTLEMQEKINSNLSINKREYVVKPLDTIKSICNKLILEEKELLKILNGQSLFIGKKIIY